MGETDLIDRQAAIDELHGKDPSQIWDTADIEVWLNTLPFEQQWIPCSERLPDMHDEVLVTARGEVSIAWLYVDGKWRSNDMPQLMFGDIIAWMPLPDPWEGENNGI